MKNKKLLVKTGSAKIVQYIDTYVRFTGEQPKVVLINRSTLDEIREENAGDSGFYSIMGVPLKYSEVGV